MKRGALPLSAAALAATGLVAAPATASAAQGVIDKPVRTTGCGKAPAGKPGQTYAQTVTSGGIARSYTVNLPKDYRKGRHYSLVLSFHGHKRTSAYQEELTGLSGTGAIVVYPQGLIGTDGESAWTGAPYSASADDVLFTSDLLNRLQRDLCVDPRRIYASGKSNGGGFTGVLACRMSGRIAAFAIASGAFYPQGGACRPRRPAPIVDFHGTADTTIPYAGVPAKGLPPIPGWLAGWADRDGCKARPAVRTEGTVEISRWRGCEHGSELIHYKVDGMGHAWPSTSPNLDSATPAPLDATPIVMRFFARHHLR